MFISIAIIIIILVAVPKKVQTNQNKIDRKTFPFSLTEDRFLLAKVQDKDGERFRTTARKKSFYFLANEQK